MKHRPIVVGENPQPERGRNLRDYSAAFSCLAKMEEDAAKMEQEWKEKRESAEKRANGFWSKVAICGLSIFA